MTKAVLHSVMLAMALIVPVVYLSTYAYFTQYVIEYLLHNLLAAISCIFLLYHMRKQGRSLFVLWLVLFIYSIAYFVRMVFITWSPDAVLKMLYTPVYVKAMQESSLIYGSMLTSISFSAFCISAVIAMYMVRATEMPEEEPLHVNVNHDSIWEHWLMGGLIVVAILLTIIAFRFNIGVMGADPGEPLPYRLKGIIFYLRSVSVPLAFILLIYLYDISGRYAASRLTIFSFFLYAMADMLIRNSRSPVLLVVLLLVFLIASGGFKLYRNERLAFGAVSVVGVFMIPVITQFRLIQRRIDLGILDDAGWLSSLQTALMNSFGNLFDALSSGVEFLLLRFPGMEAISAIVAMGATPLNTKAFEVFSTSQGMAGYLTHTVYGVSPESYTLSAPGIIGWSYLVGGEYLVLINSILTTFLLVFLWNWIDRSALQLRVILKVFLLWCVFLIFSEGTPDSMGYMVFFGISSVIFLEFVIRLHQRYLLN